MDRGAWRATVHVGAKNRTPLKQLSMHAYTHEHLLCTYYVQSRYTRHHGGSGVGKKRQDIVSHPHSISHHNETPKGRF